MIALHAASSYPRCAALHGIPPPPRASFPTKDPNTLRKECARLHVTGGGSTSPVPYNIPGIYSGNGPGITFSLCKPPLSPAIQAYLTLNNRRQLN